MRFIFSLIVLFVAQIAQAEISHPIQGKLDNGLRYTLLPLHNEKGHIEIRMKVYAGSVDETEQQAGVAHMVEHLVFRASDMHPNGVMPYLHSNKWIRGRHYNAVTTYDSTTYMMTPPQTADLKQSLEALSQMLFHAHLTQQDLDDERKIIMEEWRSKQGVGTAMNRKRTESVRVASRYARHPIIGTPESIQSIPAEQLQQFYQTWYVPNNMQLLIVGDIEPESAVESIRVFFAGIKSKTLPLRDYYEPELTDILRVNKLQDPRSGVSQIAYILRFDESASRTQTNEGRYQRLLDRIALAALTQRLRNQQNNLLEGVNSLVVRKSDIGKTTVALGLFAGVDTTGHRQGLLQIFTEIARLKHFPITEQELIKQKEIIQAQLDNAKKHTGERDFQRWVQTMSDTILSDKPYLTQPEIAVSTQPMLDNITLNEVNQRIQDWLNAQDRIVQYQPPRATQIEDISTQTVIDLQQQALQQEMTPPQTEKLIEPMSLTTLDTQGSITKEVLFAEQNVHHWTLSNGDKVIWLKLPQAKNKTYFRAQSSAGFKAQDLINWQSQIAAQLLIQNAPSDWQSEQLDDWKKQHKVNLFLNQNATTLTFDGSTENENLAQLLRLYYAYQLETNIKQGLDDSKESLLRTINLQYEKNDDRERLKALSKLRYGVESIDYLPTQDELNDLSEQELDQQWRKMSVAPTTFFIVNDMDAEDVKKTVRRYLAAIPRTKTLDSTHILPTTGKDSVRFPMNLEPKDDVRIWFFTPHQWQGKDALSVSILRNIVANKLKLSLRDEHLGIYSLRFDSTLNPETQRIESELSFASNPAMTEKLIQQAYLVLQALPQQISEEDVKQAKNQFIQAEKQRLEQPDVWLNRLVLSENHFADPRYLSDMRSLHDGITLENIRGMAANIYHAENQKVFITTPKENVQ